MTASPTQRTGRGRPAYTPLKWSHASGISLPYVFEGDAVGVRSAAHSGVERVDGCDLLAGELEVEDVEVLGDAGGLGRLRDRGAALLQVPAQHHLRGRLAVLARDLEQRRVVERALLATAVGGDAADGRPGLGDDAVLGVHAL
jgi:hypothetical protein